MFGPPLARLEPSPRVVDWSILACVLLETLSGIVSLGAGAPAQWPLFWLHRVVGLTLVVLLFFKLRRVKPRLSSEWTRSTVVSVLTATVALAALASGAAWAFGLSVDFGFWTLLNVHIGLGLLLVPFVALHLRSRFRTVGRTDFEGRRTALQYGAFLVAGALLTRLQDETSRLDAVTKRRFTGSKPVTGDGFPVTSWVADDPDPVDRNSWELRVDGLVASNLELSYDAVDAGDDCRALLDCTSGWYTTEDWRGLRLGRLLDEVGVDAEARWVTVHSVTGYRWSFPLAEARDFLLATRVDGEHLSHGHGFPVRLVAPDRRGFQWVKWVSRVELRRRRDATQYVATLVSGFS